jgi:hypothetical protein
MMYRIVYWIMVISFGYIAFHSPSVRMKIVAGLATLINGVLYW